MDDEQQERSIAHVGGKRQRKSRMEESWDALSAARERLVWSGSDPGPVQQRLLGKVKSEKRKVELK